MIGFVSILSEEKIFTFLSPERARGISEEQSFGAEFIIIKMIDASRQLASVFRVNAREF
jgi:hypothetical protein